MNMWTAFVLIAAALAAISLFNGIVSMAHGGEADARRSHRLMLERVGWQALTVLFLLFALFAQAG
jgi:hypothetical protein